MQKNEEAPVYEDTDVSSSDEFDVAIEEGRTYTVSATGKKAKGSVNFTVVTNQYSERTVCRRKTPLHKTVEKGKRKTSPAEKQGCVK